MKGSLALVAFGLAPRKDRCLKREVQFGGPLTSEGVAAVVAGGTIGVLGSVVAIEMKKIKVQSSKNCPYCMGSGSLMCASCLGTKDPNCTLCSGQGVISCENCKGRGRFIPTMLDRRASRDPESAAEDIGLL